MEISAAAKIILVFLGVLSSSRFKLPLGFGLILGGVILESWAGNTTTTVAAGLLVALRSPELWLLLLNITLILEFGYFMATEKNASFVIAAARRYGGQHGQTFSLILIPAAIGLIPMPGGALFSAPLVAQTITDPDCPPAWKAAVNYWFRHILEYWWPLYPVVIVTLSIFSLKTWQFMAIQLPFMLVSIGAGYLFLLRGRVPLLTDSSPPAAGTRRHLLKMLLPILFIVLCTLLLPGLYRHWLPAASGPTCTLLAMLSGLAGGLLYIGLLQQKTDQGLFKKLFTAKTGNVLLTLAGVMIFQNLLIASGLIPTAAAELAASRVPIEIIIAFLPFLAGLVTGIAVGFAGTAFPLVLGFMLTDETLTPLATLVLAFSMGYAGMMLSPVHLCFVLTKEYFTAPFSSVYRYILPCVMTVMVTAIFFHLLLRALAW